MQHKFTTLNIESLQPYDTIVFDLYGDLPPELTRQVQERIGQLKQHAIVINCNIINFSNYVTGERRTNYDTLYLKPIE